MISISSPPILFRTENHGCKKSPSGTAVKEILQKYWGPSFRKFKNALIFFRWVILFQFRCSLSRRQKAAKKQESSLEIFPFCTSSSLLWNSAMSDATSGKSIREKSKCNIRHSKGALPFVTAIPFPAVLGRRSDGIASLAEPAWALRRNSLMKNSPSFEPSALKNVPSVAKVWKEDEYETYQRRHTENQSNHVFQR